MMKIQATITNDHITPDIMAHIDMRYFNKGHEVPEYRSTHITLHDMAQEWINGHDQQYMVTETIDNR
jgi:hypothetical protein